MRDTGARMGRRPGVAVALALVVTLSPAGSAAAGPARSDRTAPGGLPPAVARSAGATAAVARSVIGSGAVPRSDVASASVSRSDGARRVGAGPHPTSEAVGPSGFPPSDSRYHDYAEMVAHIKRVARTHPTIVQLLGIGKSHEGRTIWAAKVSDRVTVDEAEPEVLFDGLHHAGEHLSAEMAISILDLLTSRYGRATRLGRRVTAIVDSREVWIVFMVNPDGGEYHLSGDPYRPWRKNRQPTPGSSSIGTDLNRNYGYRWGCCRGSSRRPSSPAYRGPEPWSAPETRAIRDLVLGRIVGGRQQIRVAITFHIPGRLVLWPYGYTSADVPPDMTRLDRRTYVAMGRAMAARNGYLPLQWGDGRRVDGVAIDWLYGSQRIFAYLVELGTSDRIPDEQIEPETSRNRDAVLYLMERAGCPYRAIGRAADFCGPFFDDLEIARGWRIDPEGTDGATAGAWARGIPTEGAHQLGTPTSGQSVLATGLRGRHDVDGGTTTVRSPMVRLPSRPTSLHLSYWVGFGAGASDRDRFRVRIVGSDGRVLANALTIRGDGAKRSPSWRSLDFRMPTGSVGRNVAIELVATDTGADSIVEAGVDQVRITAP